ncbi:NAD(P)H-dependent oxidoreductase [Bradyrhizobium sp. ARR65]|uniref:NADPH-dependent FMN reductase n=1 Tax=Bradyrhizobium sp. ARR65 TaxID=1040989 RepID=UPI0004655FF4|nr:NAD(P)H-dependent oxidoreductase [Bradyrhizobium sp. ARR65]
MHNRVAKAHFVGVAGSLRKASYSSAVLSSLRDHAAEMATLEILDLRLPLYSEDDDGAATPEAVRDFRQAIGASDGVVIVTPEYNHGIPGVLKNALDWASRPFGRSVLIGKPVLAMSVSPAFTGGVRAHAQVNETLLAIQARIVPGPQVVIGSVAEKIRDGILVDESCQRFALAALDRLIKISGSLEGSLPA